VFADGGHLATQCHIDAENHSTHYRVGKWKPLFLLSSVVTFQLQPGFASRLAFVSSPNSFVSPAG
jgi:hypothetical protein